MSTGRTFATFAVSSFIVCAAANVASAQTPGTVYVLHSAPAGSCPSLDWHVVMGTNDTLTGMLGWNDMKSMARLDGTITSDKTFKMDAKEVGGAGKTAIVEGKVIPGWFLASIKGPGIDCEGIKVGVWVPKPQG
jgi:hypothetical protein